MQEKSLKIRRGKFWIKSYPPKFLGGQDRPLVKVLFSDPQDLINRVVLVKGSTVTGRFQDRALNLFFRITRVNPQGAFTSLIGAKMGRENVTSKVRRRTTKVELIGRYNTKNDVTVKVNLFAITVHRCNRRYEKKLREFYDDFLAEKVSHVETHDELIYDLAVEGKWDETMRTKSSRIYPIRDLVIEKVRAEDFLIAPNKVEEQVGRTEEILSNAERFS